MVSGVNGCLSLTSAHCLFAVPCMDWGGGGGGGEGGRGNAS